MGIGMSKREDIIDGKFAAGSNGGLVYTEVIGWVDLGHARGKDIRDILDLVRQYDFTGQRRVSFEYTMFSGFNDSIRHADALSRLLKGLECRVNLIRFHRIPDFQYDCPSDAVIRRFQERLNANGILATVRASRGEDILAACGMLAGKQKK